MAGHGEKVRVRRRTHVERAYRWPEIFLFITLFLLFVCASVILGAWAYIEYVQHRIMVPIPWYFPYVIAISAITIAYIIVLVVLYFIHLLLPIVVMITSFILFVLWLVALVKVSIELWGPLGSVNDNCVRFVYQSGWWGGQTLDTLARIQQEGVCNLWKTVFAMEMIGTCMLLLLLLMATQVMRARTVIYER